MTLKRITIIILIAMFIASLTTAQSTMATEHPKTIIVPDQYTSIQEAINSANSGDTIFIKNGLYNVTHYASYDAIVIDKSISLVGESNQTIISTEYWKYTSALIGVKSDDVTISGLTLINGGRSHGIDIGGSKCRVTNNQLDCMIQVSGKNNLISGNSISNVTFFGGIMCEHDDSAIIINNTIANCRDSAGIWIDDSNNTTLKQNKIMNCGDGITIGFYLDLGYKTNNTLAQDNILMSNGNGIVLGPSNLSRVFSNTITDNVGAGVKFNQNCNGSLIYGNLISQNEMGFRLTFQNKTQYCTENTVYFNNIVANQKDVIIDQFGNSTAISWDYAEKGNYWSDYYGNGSYTIDSNNVDHYPFTQQVDANSIFPTPTPSVIIGNFSLLAIVSIPIVAVLALVISIFYRKHRRVSKQ
jgi:parallel beta-helix repeat protein